MMAEKRVDFSFHGELWFLRNDDGEYLMLEPEIGKAIVLCETANDAFAVQETAGDEFKPTRYVNPTEAVDLLDVLRAGGLKYVAHKIPEGLVVAPVEVIIGKLLNQ